MASKVNIVRMNSYFKRFWGLMGRRSLPEDTLFCLEPCGSIHTFWMRVAIDVIFVDRDGKILARYACVPPNKLLSCKGAYAVLEGACGILDRHSMEVGDTLALL